METITIQVDVEIAKAYREATPEKQQKIATIVNDWLKSIIQDKSLEQIIRDLQIQKIPIKIEKFITNISDGNYTNRKNKVKILL